MSVVPYVADRQVVLRHNELVVLYDPQSRQFGVAADAYDKCPFCHRPYIGTDVPQEAGSSTASFSRPEYFRMLRESLPAEESASISSIPLLDDKAADQVPPSVGISANAFSPGYFKRFFVVQRELGRGGQGVVLLVTHVLDNVELGLYACKRVPVGNNHAWLANVLNEVRLLEPISHQHLVHYKHVWLEDVQISKFGPSVPCAFILQQYCNAGDLYHYIIQIMPGRRGSQAEQLQARKLRFEEIYSFFKDITSGLHHLHVNGFVHRDLKPSNCLLHETGHGLRVLVSDFGEVQVKNMARTSSGATGTVSFCAPEVLRIDAVTGTFGNFTTKSDIFSLGMTLYFLCFARLPYRHADCVHEENEDIDQLKAEIGAWTGLHQERNLRPDLPPALYDSLEMLLAVDPAQRPRTEDILRGIKKEAMHTDPPNHWTPKTPLLQDRISPKRHLYQGRWTKVGRPLLLATKVAIPMSICSPWAIRPFWACLLLLGASFDLCLPRRYILLNVFLHAGIIMALRPYSLCESPPG